MSTKKIQAKANDPAPKAKKAETKTANAADKPKREPRTEEQKKARRERDAKRRALAAAKKPAEKKADASDSKVAIKCTFEIGGINKNVADLYGSIMSKVFEHVSTDIKNLLNAMDDVVLEARKK